jgi:FtsP/CotA-like multicopper oxidase with cupredoxin domain
VKRAVVLILSIGLFLCGVGVAVATSLWGRTSISTAGEVDFATPLAIPPLASSKVDEGRRVFDLTAAAGEHDFGGGPTRTWGFNGDYLGPTLRAKRGEQVIVHVHNRLDEPTTVHWHGMYLPARMDGGPHQAIEPGATWSPAWQIDQPAATLWYHPHPHGETARQVYRGLAGMFLIDDPATSAAGLPSSYGVDDIPVIVQDKQLTRGGDMAEGGSFLGDVGILGRTVAVNGTVGPYLDVRTEHIRLRLLNASNARVYGFGFADGRRFALVGTDGGLLPQAYETDRVKLSPGERAEIVVTVRAGERAVLRSFPPGLGIGSVGDRFVGGADTLDILEVRAAAQLRQSPPIPAKLAGMPRLDPSAAVQQRDFTLTGRRINGREMDLNRIDATVAAGSVEIWTVVNADGTPHTFHVHGVQFQILSAGGGAPPPELSGWKDTVYLTPMVRHALIMRFPAYADPSAPYMFHCHVLLHEDGGMMGQFAVVAPGQSAQPPHHH